MYSGFRLLLCKPKFIYCKDQLFDLIRFCFTVFRRLQVDARVHWPRHFVYAVAALLPWRAEIMLGDLSCICEPDANGVGSHSGFKIADRIRHGRSVYDTTIDTVKPYRRSCSDASFAAPLRKRAS
jgi:hypothetical protein